MEPCPQLSGRHSLARSSPCSVASRPWLAAPRSIWRTIGDAWSWSTSGPLGVNPAARRFRGSTRCVAATARGTGDYRRQRRRRTRRRQSASCANARRIRSAVRLARRARRAVKVQGMPSSFVYDRDGKLVGTHLGFRENQRAEHEAEIQTASLAEHHMTRKSFRMPIKLLAALACTTHLWLHQSRRETVGTRSAGARRDATRRQPPGYHARRSHLLQQGRYQRRARLWRRRLRV